MGPVEPPYEGIKKVLLLEVALTGTAIELPTQDSHST